jgi:hypothetical protein
VILDFMIWILDWAAGGRCACAFFFTNRRSLQYGNEPVQEVQQSD